MPTAPARPCRHPMCPATTNDGSGYCDTHRRQDGKRRYRDKGDLYDRGRGTSTERGYGTREWRPIRDAVLRGEPLCRRCRASGYRKPADLVHHIDRNPRNNSHTNLEPLCYRCHAEEHGAYKGMESIHRPDFHLPGCPVMMVCGPPGSGKSSYASDNAGPEDMIIDLDVIMASISGGLYKDHCDQELVRQALQKRNGILKELKNKTTGKVYYIVSLPDKDARAWWKEKLGARVIVLEVPADECIRRIHADGRRPQGLKELNVQLVKEWWENYQRNHGEVALGPGG